MTDSGGFTKTGYSPTGVIHPGEYLIPAPYDYPKWWTRVSKFVWPRKLKMAIQRKVRVYNLDRDYFLKLTGKRAFDD